MKVKIVKKKNKPQTNKLENTPHTHQGEDKYCIIPRQFHIHVASKSLRRCPIYYYPQISVLTIPPQENPIKLTLRSHLSPGYGGRDC